MWVQKPGPLQEQQVILAAEPSLQPSNWYFEEEKHGPTSGVIQSEKGLSRQGQTGWRCARHACSPGWQVNTTCLMELTQEGPLTRVHTTL